MKHAHPEGPYNREWQNLRIGDQVLFFSLEAIPILGVITEIREHGIFLIEPLLASQGDNSWLWCGYRMFPLGGVQKALQAYFGRADE